MLAKHLLLVSVFVGGCLSGVFAVGFSTRDVEPSKAANDTAHSDEGGVASLAAAEGAGEGSEGVRASATPGATEPHARGRATDLAPAPHDGVAGSNPPEPEETHSVGDVLARLEAAYREQLADAARAPAAPSPPPVQEPSPVPARAPSVHEESPRATSPGAVGEVAVITAPVDESPEIGAPRSRSLEVEAPVVAHRDATPPSVVYTSNVQQNIHVGQVVQGDVYQLELQQLAIFQYLQMLAASSQPRVAMPASAPPARPSRTFHTARQKPAFPTSITNPDNPWGFVFPPPMLAK